MRTIHALLAVCILTAASFGQTPAGFNLGDLYVFSDKLYDGASFYGLARIDPLTGATSTVVKMFPGGTNVVYDPARDRIAFYGRLPVNPNNQLHFLTPNGTFTSSLTLPFTPRSLTPGANGKLYISTPTGPNGIHWLALNNTLTPLKDAGGSANFTYGGCAFDLAHYDSGTNAIFLLQCSAATACGQPALSTHKVVKVPLNADGTKVGGAITESQFCLGVYGLMATGLSRGPQGSLVAVFDKNGGTGIPLLQRIDTATLAVGPFATPDFMGDNVISCGAYSQLLGRAVIIDTWNNVARSFAYGQSGAGAILVPDTANPKLSEPGSSYGEFGTICSVDLGDGGLTSYGTGIPGCNGAHALSALSAPKAGIPGFRFTCTTAPPLSTGLLLFGNAADYAGTDSLYVGVPLYLDIFLSTEIVALDLYSDALGSSATAPLTLPPAAIGLSYFGTAFWAWTSCSLPPYNLSGSQGLQVTILP